MSITNLADIAVAPILGLASAIAVPVVTRAGAVPIARINAVALNTAQDALSCEELRQRACTELLRQAAQDAGLLDAGDTMRRTKRTTGLANACGRGTSCSL